MSSEPYDIANPTTPEVWLAMDESDRIAAVEDAHARTRAAVGSNPTAHAAIHVAVENRLAEGHAVVIAAYERFRAAGVDRHTTVHALASVVTQQLMAVLEQRTPSSQEEADRDFAALDPKAFERKR